MVDEGAEDSLQLGMWVGEAGNGVEAGKGLLEKVGSFGRSAEVEVGCGQVVHADQCVRMLRTELEDEARQRAAAEVQISRATSTTSSSRRIPGIFRDQNFFLTHTPL